MTRVVRIFTVLVLAGGASTLPAETARPSIVLVLADDLGQETLGAYGGASYSTPRLDGLARAGMRFEHCYSLPVCHPTRISLLTGRYPFRLGRPRWGTFPREEEERTLARVLKDAGYATAVAGKWQLTLLREDPGHPHRMGFDEYSLFGWHEGPRYYRPLIWQNKGLRQDVEDRYGPDVYCDFLIDFMERHRDRPFFAFYSMALCHDVTDDLDRPVPFGPRGRYDSYREMVEAMDERVGRIVDAIDRLGLAERTLVLFTADNGTPKGSIINAKDGRLVREPVSSMRGTKVIPGGKGDLTDGGTRVPLIARWPGQIEPGQVSDHLVDTSDFLPTFAELAGAEVPGGVVLDGKSFAAALKGGAGAGRRWAYSERGEEGWVRTQRFKLYRSGRLFDLRDDPEEKRPVDPGAAIGEEAKTALGELRGALRRLFPPARILSRRVLLKQPGRYIGWPSIARTRGGDLIAVFSGDREAHVSPDGKTQMIRSSDGGRTWSEPRTINDLPVDDRDAGILVTKKGTLIVSWFTGPPYGTEFEGHYIIRSADDGRTWSRPQRIGVSTPHGPVQLSDGRILFVGQHPHCSQTRPKDYNGPPEGSPHYIGIEESRDDGLTWSEIARFPVPADARMLSYDEPHLVETRSGKLVLMFRDCNAPNRLIQSESPDGGRTWTAPHVTPLRGYPPHLFALRNGWLLVTYAKRWPPYGQYACLSRDEGKTWDVGNEIRLSEAPNGDLGYPASVELDDGTVWTVYYEVDRPGEKPCLKGTHWELLGRRDGTGPSTGSGRPAKRDHAGE